MNIQDVFMNMIEFSNAERNLPLETYVDLKELETSKEFIEKFKKVFPWHFQDSQRSFLTDKINNPVYEFSYYQRMRIHFGINQIEAAIKNPRMNLISTFDPKKDFSEKGRVPCFMQMYLLRNKDTIDFVVIFRNRDICRRVIPNWVAFNELQKEICKKMKLKQGITVDISIRHFTKGFDIDKLRKGGVI